MTLSNDLVFIDTETTGLELEHDIWEIAYAIGDGPVVSAIVPHSLQNADLKALEMNGYRVRFQPGFVDRTFDVDLRSRLAGKTLVGANPSFDAYRLQRRWGVAPWRYRMLDVESMAFGLVSGFDSVPGLKNLTGYLQTNGYQVPSNDHSAAGDVAAVREVYKSLLHIKNLGAA